MFNATPDTQTQTVPALAGEAYALHPVQAGGSDAIVKTATYNPATGAFTVPAQNRRRLHHPITPELSASVRAVASSGADSSGSPPSKKS